MMIINPLKPSGYYGYHVKVKEEVFPSTGLGGP
jgi:hypothetical protein